MKILERLPIYDEATLIDVRGDVYQVWQNVPVQFEQAIGPIDRLLIHGFGPTRPLGTDRVS